MVGKTIYSDSNWVTVGVLFVGYVAVVCAGFFAMMTANSVDVISGWFMVTALAAVLARDRFVTAAGLYMEEDNG